MKTFKEFIEESTKRKGQKYDSRNNFDADSKHDDVKIKKPSNYQTHIHHKKSGITYKVIHADGVDKDNKPDSKMHDKKPNHYVSWKHNHGDEIDDKKKRQIARDAKHVYDKHVHHRIPSGHVVSNIPMKNYRIQKGKVKETNTRAKIYQRSGFGKLGKDRRMQYSVKIGNKLHPVDNTGKRKEGEGLNKEKKEEK